MKFKLPKFKFKLPFHKKSRALVLRRSPFKKLFGKFKYSRLGWRLWKKVLIYGGLSLVFIILATFAWFAKDLPTPGKIKARHASESTQLYDRKGNLLYTVSGEIKRTTIDFKDMPQNIKDATIVAEDRSFYHNFGVNFKGVFRAVYYNVFLRRSGNYQGGSTITQQFVKNALLSPKQTITRKIKELILSLEIEAMYSKDEILAFYLNEIPYGSNAYGIQAASEIYFGKDAKNLSLAQCATIAAMAQAPTYYSPYGSHIDELKWRRNWILDNMANQGYISQEKADKSSKSKMKFIRRREYIKAPHFVMYVKEVLAAKYGDRMVEEGGLKVTTTLDPQKQKIAEESVRNGAARNLAVIRATNAALVAIDPKTGQVLAMVGSKDYWDESIDGQVNVATAKRQPGSAFKPVVYATAFKSHWSPASTLFDVRTDFGGGYTPNNYDMTFRGPLSIREALGQSKNVPAVKMLYLAGLKNSLKTAEDMGITTLTDPDRYGLALVLGGGEIRLTELTGAYSVFAAEGIKNDVNPILKVIEPSGNILEENKESKGKEVLNPQIAYQISSILSDNRARTPVFGSNSSLYIPGRDVAVKTGTTDGFKDAWTIGYTPSIAAGVWVGNNNNSPMTAGAAGAMAAAPIWREFITRALGSSPNESFKKPAGIKTVTVDALTGKLPSGKGPLGLRTDIFTDWQIPKERASQYTTVKICTACSGQKLAGDDCPPDMIVEKTYANVHSEVPEKPNWEAPVRAWAAAHNLGSVAPTQVCNLHGKNPSITITSPSSGESVSGPTIISTSIAAPLGVSRVVFYADGISIRTDYSSPYSQSYNMSNLSAGSHTIRATVVDRGGLTDSDSILINVVGDSSAPGSPSDIGGTKSGAAIRIYWTNPDDSDFSYVNIYKSTSSSFDFSSYWNRKSGSPGSADSIDDWGPFIPNHWYYYVIRPVDIDGNENQNTKIIKIKA
jgi:1A family penicillin-binding protein